MEIFRAILLARLREGSHGTWKCAGRNTACSARNDSDVRDTEFDDSTFATSDLSGQCGNILRLQAFDGELADCTVDTLFAMCMGILADRISRVQSDGFHIHCNWCALLHEQLRAFLAAKFYERFVDPGGIVCIDFLRT